MGKDLHLVKLDKGISGKEKVWLRMILKEPRRNFLCCLAADKQRVKKGGSRQGGSLRRCVKSGREAF